MTYLPFSVYEQLAMLRTLGYLHHNRPTCASWLLSRLGIPFRYAHPFLSTISLSYSSIHTFQLLFSRPTSLFTCPHTDNHDIFVVTSTAFYFLHGPTVVCSHFLIQAVLRDFYLLRLFRPCSLPSFPASGQPLRKQVHFPRSAQICTFG